MRLLLRSAALLTAMTVSFAAAHAAPITYTGTVVITDTTTNTNITSPSDSFTFTDPPLGGLFQYDDSYGIDGRISKGDDIDMKITFTSPGSGNGTVAGSVDFSSFFQSDYIQWNAGTQTIDLSNGSIVNLTLATFLGDPVTSLSTCNRNQLCGSSDIYMQVADNDPPAAATPEPSSLMLLGTGVLGAAGMIRRRLAI